MKITQETGFHLAGLATTGFAAHAAVTYLQTVTPDLATAYGFSAAISAAVYYGWKFTLNSKSAKRGIPLLLASVIMTAVSGYTVYQASVLPLQNAAIAAAAATDAPRLEEYNTAKAKQQQAVDNLQTSINDLRQQNNADQSAITKITGKSADWKKQQLRNSIETRNTQLTELQSKIANLTPQEWKATPPTPLDATQTAPLLARAFAFELIMIMFMLFARFAKDDKARATRKEALELVAITSTTNRMIDALKTQLAHTEKASRELAQSMERRATAAKESATQHLTAEIQHMEKRAKEASENLQKDINETTRTLERLLAHADKRANECANTPFARANEGANSPHDGLSPEQVINLLKNRLLEPSEKGNFTPEIIMEKAGVGMRKAKSILKELA